MRSYVNVTNQPIFASGSSCDQQTTYYNTTLSTEKVGVRGNISIASPYLPSESSFTGVYGLRTTIGFVEDGYKDCQSLKGYSYSEIHHSLEGETVEEGHLEPQRPLGKKR